MATTPRTLRVGRVTTAGTYHYAGHLSSSGYCPLRMPHPHSSPAVRASLVAPTLFVLGTCLYALWLKPSGQSPHGRRRPPPPDDSPLLVYTGSTHAPPASKSPSILAAGAPLSSCCCPCCPPGSLSASSFHLDAVEHLTGRGWRGALPRCTFLVVFPSRIGWSMLIMGSVCTFFKHQTRRQGVKTN